MKNTAKINTLETQLNNHITNKEVYLKELRSLIYNYQEYEYDNLHEIDDLISKINVLNTSISIITSMLQRFDPDG